MKLLNFVMIVMMTVIFSLTGCKSKHDTQPKIEKTQPTQETNKTQPIEKVEPVIYEEDDDEIRFFHEDIQIIRLSGFEDACKSCNRGYRTKLVCGYAYNPDCAALLTNSSEVKLEAKASTVVLDELIKAIKEAKDGKK